MLLDIKVKNQYIITCDRDEKIRISHYPNAYNIHNFCLGHTDFVTSIEVVDENHLISTSGDGTMKLWHFLQGKILASVTCAEDAGLDQLKIDQADNEENIPNQLKVKRTTYWPSVLGVRIVPQESSGKVLAAVTIEKFQGFVLYEIEQNVMKFRQKVETEGPIWDFEFINSETLVFVTAVQGKNLQTLHIGAKEKKANVIEFSTSLEDFFKGEQ